MTIVFLLLAAACGLYLVGLLVALVYAVLMVVLGILERSSDITGHAIGFLIRVVLMMLVGTAAFVACLHFAGVLQ
jgi:hypothetical protein